MGPLALLVMLLAQEPASRLLETHCTGCHNPRTMKSKLDLTTRESLLRGGHSGAAVVPGNAPASFLYKVITRREEPFMPHKREKLSDETIAQIAAWIDAGVPYSRPLLVPGEKRERTHWSFLPLRRPTPPRVKNEARVRTPIDRFILASADPAGKRRLIRRATFDLIGLPPTPEEIEAFLADESPTAYARLIDRLLESPHYGERWGRHWLDAARYADSSGYESDFDQKSAYRYRDFVIRALNDDLPFDTFVRWQLAGDEIAPENPLAVTATGFCTIGPWVRFRPSETDTQNEKKRNDELDDILSTTASAFLGLTIGCARCHDHKFDPISQKEYYELTACFAPAVRKERSLSASLRRLEEWVESRRNALRWEKIDTLPLTDEQKKYLFHPKDKNVVSSRNIHKKYGKQMEVTDDVFGRWLSPDEQKKWKRLKRAAGPKAPSALSLRNLEEPVKTHLLGRGEADHKIEEVRPGFLSVLTSNPVRVPTDRRRTALANWITDVDGGAGRLLARVAANRLWLHHFGEGLVATPNDFGAQGARPTHPDLLEWLASELVIRGWRLKDMHRLIMTSAVYVQGTTGRPRRLESEILRDSILAVSGKLNRTLYGPAVRVRIPRAAMSTRTKDAYPADLREGEKNWRRSCYLFVKRSVMTPMMEIFDGPNASASCGKRARTTVATQALTLLNDPFVRARAKDFADRVASEAGSDHGARVRRAYLLALGRPPKPIELEASLAFLDDPDPRTLTDFCQTLFSLNEFFYVD